MSILDRIQNKIKKAWYNEHETDIYNSDDFDGLWAAVKIWSQIALLTRFDQGHQLGDKVAHGGFGVGLFKGFNVLVKLIDIQNIFSRLGVCLFGEVLKVPRLLQEL